MIPSVIIQHAALLSALSGLSWDSVLQETDVQKAFDVFYAGAMSLFDQYYPVHTITLFNRDPQFITPRINALLKRRNRLMRRGDVATANSLTDRIRQKKITAHSCSHLLSNVPHGSTEMWQMIRQVTGKQKRPIDKLVNVNVEDLNRHYATISTNVQYEKPNPKATVLSHLQVFSEYNVFRMLDKIKPTAMGLDGLPDWFIRLAAPAFATPLTYLFNLSLEHSVVPVQWKSSCISPIPKVNQPSCCSDYRPISITPVLSRIMEKMLVRSILYPVLSEPEFRHLFSDQFAFRPTGSTTSALIYVLAYNNSPPRT